MVRPATRSAKRSERRREGAAPGAWGGGRRPARIYREIQVDGSRYWALFDSGARRTYVIRPVARLIGTKRLREPLKRAIAGRVYRITEGCMLVGSLEGRGIDAGALVVDRLFPDEDGRSIEIIVGAEAMETWGVCLDLPNKRLDFTHYQKEAYEG